METVKEILNKYKHFFVYLFFIIIIFMLSFDGCKKEVNNIIFEQTNNKIDSLEIAIEKSRHVEDSLNRVISQKKENIRDLYAKLQKTEDDKLKKDEEKIRKSINSDSISVDGIIKFWTEQFKRN